MDDTVPYGKGYILFDEANIRFKKKEKYFADEYQVINQRRFMLNRIEKQHMGRPDNLSGIGFSGGGIKASAFHLGLISGLHQAGLLSRMDYIASVSGGSWANGAYWAVHETDDALFECLDTITHAKFTDDEPDPQEIYRCKKYKALLPNKQNNFLGGRNWQRQIRSDYLLNDDITFSDFLEFDKKHLYDKPFPVFFSTHSNKFFGLKDPENFPFEITPLGFGTIADCKTEIGGQTCGLLRRWLRPHLWKYPPEKGFYVPYETEGDFGYETEGGIDVTIKKYSDDRDESLCLSHAMWSSGGLVAKVMSLHLRILQNDKQVKGIKKKYVLSDGGKADNTGLTPLVERGVDLIVLSQIAEDAEIECGDIKIASQQVERLFDVDIGVNNVVYPEHQPLISESNYAGNKKIVFVKPTPNNIDDFYDSRYCKNKFVKYLLDIERKKTKAKRFPQNKTVAFRYPQEIIYGYYLLGRFIGHEKLADKIRP